MKRTYTYKPDKTGKVRPLLLIDPLKSVHYIGSQDFEKRMQKNLYDLECKEGSRFRGAQEFSPSTLKRVWVDNVERDNHRDARRDTAMARRLAETGV